MTRVSRGMGLGGGFCLGGLLFCEGCFASFAVLGPFTNGPYDWPSIVVHERPVRVGFPIYRVGCCLYIRMGWVFFVGWSVWLWENG